MTQLFMALILFAFSFAAIGQEHPEILRKKELFRQLQNFQSSRAGEMYDVKHYELNLYIDPEIYGISGTVTTLFEMKTANNTVSFDFRNNMIIDSIMYDNQLISDYSHENHILTVNLPDRLKRGDLSSVSISYHGEPLSLGLESFVRYQHGYGDNRAWIIWTLSCPYGAYTWWPCKQTLDDKADSVDIIVTVPEGNRVASNGVLLSSEIIGEKVKHHWKHRHPVATYLIAIAVTNYSELITEVSVEGQNPIPIIDYCYPQNMSSWQANQHHAVNAMKIFNELFILYPYADEKYGHAQFGWGGGMEHQTMSFMSNLDEMLVVHELAHQWFGDYITCENWSHVWLNEGFATYCEGLYREKNNTENYFLTWRRSKNSSATSLPGGSVYCYNSDDENAIFDSRLSYNKGGMVLHVLRRQVGDEAFFTGIRNYLQDPKLKNNFANTEDFRAHIEMAADTTLAEFFDQWIYKEGYPQYKIFWNAGEHKTSLRVSQTPSHQSVSFFKLKIPIRFRNLTNGQDTIIWFHNTYNEQIFEIELGFKPTIVQLDPNTELLTRNNDVIKTDDIQPFTFKIYPNPSSSGEVFITAANHIQKILVHTADGKYILTKDHPEKTVTLALKSGIYLITIIFNDKISFIEKVIVK